MSAADQIQLEVGQVWRIPSTRGRVHLIAQDRDRWTWGQNSTQRKGVMTGDEMRVWLRLCRAELVRGPV